MHCVLRAPESDANCGIVAELYPRLLDLFELARIKIETQTAEGRFKIH